MTRSDPTIEKKLIRLLQKAYSGELAAFYAYEGHWRSVRLQSERAEIQKIQNQEFEHRECIGHFLKALNASPDPLLELVFTCIGRTISLLCFIGGWLLPMYGAGKLESGNVVEYEVAALLAFKYGRMDWADTLLEMAEVEWDHELYFRKKCESHWAYAFMPKWKQPASRQSIRERFKNHSEKTLHQ